MRFPVLPFALASFAPVPLLAYGGFQGGAALWVAVIYTSIFAFFMDQILPHTNRDGSETGEFPAANALSVLLALSHLALMPLAVMSVAGLTGLGGAERVGAFFGFGLYFGQVSNSNAHELIHRGDKILFSLGKWVYISMLYGHHTTAHRLLHHVHVSTPLDPNFPPKGRSFYRYFLRGWVGSFTRGYRVEQQRAARAGRVTPYVAYVGGGLAFLLAFGLAFGWGGVAAYLGLCFYAQSQLAMVDYLQHYGLARQKLPDGSYEPQASHHSWNSPHWFSSHMMVNAARHSDHHANPNRMYPALRLPQDHPVLPYSLPAMGIVALLPALWFKLMDKRVDKVLSTARQAAIKG
ncbi:alkane 1-monooxygenase [Roseinatronobacter sp. NSM]|uniref:alkane 1-monooxygenase n=1 Tax=Roseinatronobacter sp. NSM TaxID=3457785 RepID=UPI0040366A69